MKLKPEIIERIKKNRRCKKELFIMNNCFDTRTIDNWIARNDQRLCFNFNLEIISKWLNVPTDQLIDIDEQTQSKVA